MEMPKKKEIAPDGSKDENVFDIQQGVSINIFIRNNKKSLITDKHGEKEDIKLAKVYHYDLYGLRNDKYDFLFEQNMHSLKWQQLKFKTPAFFFVPKSNDNQEKYETGFLINDFFKSRVTGIVTMGDGFIIDKQKSIIKERILKLKNNEYDEHKLDKEFSLGKNYSKWIFNTTQKIKFEESKLVRINYRPFDIRWTYYDNNLIWRWREKVMKYLLNGKNIGLVTCRQGATNSWELANITKNIVDDSYVSNRTKERGYIFPLYIYTGKKRHPNLNPKIIDEIEQKLNLSFVPEKGDSLTLTSEGFRDGSFAPGQLVENSFSPLDLFDYIYAVLHSPAYRETYREFLKIDFPRIPYPLDSQNFWKLAALGGELRLLHLLEGPKFEKIEADSVPTKKVLVEKVKYSDGRVFVNKDFYFENVPQTAWEFFIGGYQPAQKWLKDRKGCILKSEDFKHYRKIVLALTETARIMGEIDKVGVV